MKEEEETHDSSGEKSMEIDLSSSESAITGDTFDELWENYVLHVSDPSVLHMEFHAVIKETLQEEQEREETDFSEARKSCNYQKNRYTNILPYDQTRVKLKPSKADGSDYINANFITTFDLFPKVAHKITYIAASAPLKSTLNDWWRMVWEHKCGVIVMVTKCVEGTSLKCEQYWPEVENTLKYGKIKVTNDETTTLQNLSIIIRKFTLALGKKERKVVQYQYVSWPDHGVPEEGVGLEHILQLVNTHYENNLTENNPLLVHCSAGIGRTGTFIILHTLLNILDYYFHKDEDNDTYTLKHEEDPPIIDFKNLLKHIRHQRPGFLTQNGQYMFIYQTAAVIIGTKLGKPPEVYQNVMKLG
eukprot:CAMPEP_0174268994 /NCGR_PEP_ID=MMETSP0439-20130205/39471_1 /TAXON_ID=0 /ORGANISM="Stereomyxa ramosa, Strain Chinc5" /LENGTH=358 /DNA_ID=CAMNT_0015357517 /DNA_START=37 /DNA_END=1110 /DNA_ORIENTATION=-